MNQELLRKLPKVDEILSDERVKQAAGGLAHEQAADAVRESVNELRQSILRGEKVEESDVSHDAAVEMVLARMRKAGMPSLRRVINATGVVLHTNLGRARLSERAKEAVKDTADSYSTLEYDPAAGKRGSRHVHCEKLIQRITGAEAAMVVNNNAAATMLALAVLGEGKEIILYRGEMVEIGGSFRVPEIMETSGAFLKEIGTTNKTHLYDYERAITENTGALMKVHTSNYKVVGFTDDVSVKELRTLADKYDLPLLYDLGSGLMVNLEEYGIMEPTIRSGLADGADIVLFSGDKLLGGPQGGIIVGKKSIIDKMKKHPLARVLRVDKMTLSAMEATFNAYFDEEKAKEEIPVLNMLTRDPMLLQQEARDLLQRIQSLDAGYEAEVVESTGLVGGGSAPGTELPGYGVALKHPAFSEKELDEKLRDGLLPVVTRTVHDHILFDVRTMTAKEREETAAKLGVIAGK